MQFLSTDKLDQTIPFVRVTNADGSVDDYVDVESDLDPKSVDPGSLKTVDCITCHNRVSHTVAQPADSIESSISRGVISSDIPYIRNLGVQVLSREYASQEQAFAGIAQALDEYYKTSYPDFYATDKDKLDAAIAEGRLVVGHNAKVWAVAYTGISRTKCSLCLPISWTRPSHTSG